VTRLFYEGQISGGLTGLLWCWNNNNQGIFFCSSKAIQNSGGLERLFLHFILGIISHCLVFVDHKVGSADASDFVGVLDMNDILKLSNDSVRRNGHNINTGALVCLTSQ
jgi:hypothetical protein